MDFGSFFLTQLLYPWLAVFAAPFEHTDLLWITIPIILSWAVTELYQEKKGTSLGNAISNGVVVLWVGIDWLRQIVSDYAGASAAFITKLCISASVLIFGGWIILHAMATHKKSLIFGRVRVITYVLLMLTPVMYGVVNMTWGLFFAMVLFAPVFYFVIEIVDRIIPDPQAVQKDNERSMNERTVNIQITKPVFDKMSKDEKKTFGILAQKIAEKQNASSTDYVPQMQVNKGPNQFHMRYPQPVNNGNPQMHGSAHAGYKAHRRVGN